MEKPRNMSLVYSVDWIKKQPNRWKSEATLRTVGIVNTHKDGVIIQGLNHVHKMLGAASDDRLPGESFIDMCCVMDNEGWRTLVKELEARSVVQFESQFRSTKGLSEHLSCTAVCEVGARVISFYVSPADAPTKNETKRLINAFLDTDLVDINIKNLDHRYLVTSALFDKTFDLGRGEPIGKTALEIYEEPFSEHVNNHDNMVLEMNEVITQIDVVPETGQHLLVQKFPLYENNIPIGIGVIGTDVTALVKSEEKEKQHKKKFSDYADLCADILWETDTNWNIVDSNLYGGIWIHGINFTKGNNLLDQLKDILVSTASLESFFAKLIPNQINKHTFATKTGIRFKLGIKPTLSGDPEKAQINRGILILERNEKN